MILNNANELHAMRQAFCKSDLDAGSFAPQTMHTGTLMSSTDSGFIVSFGPFKGFLAYSQLGNATSGSLRLNVRTRVFVVGLQGDILLLTRYGIGRKTLPKNLRQRVNGRCA